MKLDIRVENHGSLFLLRWLTDEGMRWIADHTSPEDSQVFGGALVVEPRYVADIIEGARADGLEVA